ncbi:hypothetical protein HPDFL43_00035460 [Hoeflea phototrophica DFL-43]|jgi:hypothetical protein|uniref:Uncharacterized protein n=1 Tax=Hoeflea phototrophica (strain DSM 17068 / NCIMB 14078 / DFL-43) TaxID=411684 RepID=A0A094ZYN9_HOEPD|nr:hypothetical protein HPDFL43_00035460 [Hoeflea phototrophica DFL-43]
MPAPLDSKSPDFMENNNVTLDSYLPLIPQHQLTLPIFMRGQAKRANYSLFAANRAGSHCVPTCIPHTSEDLCCFAHYNQANRTHGL